MSRGSTEDPGGGLGRESGGGGCERTGKPGGGSRGSYAGIASINTSVRDTKNILEVRLERSENAKFNLSMSETESLLVKLGIDSSHFLGVSSCPEGKGVVYITLHSSVNISRFLSRPESYILKEGIRTAGIFQAGKKEVSVTISGLHPNTKDQAVIRYLAAHGKVSQKDKVIHHVYPGEAGSTLLAGKLNGDRSYMVEILKPMGSFHIIDGEKVSVKYRGQLRTCARCHRSERDCSGKGIARECTGERVLLSIHMERHWEEVGFIPDRGTINGEDIELDVDVQIGKDNIQNVVKSGPDFTQRYTAININGFSAEVQIPEIHKIFLEHGLPTSVTHDQLLRKEKTSRITVENLGPADCLRIMENMHGKKFLGKKIFITPIVAASPSKLATATAVKSGSSSLSATSTVSTSSLTPPYSGAAHQGPPPPPPPPPPPLPTSSAGVRPPQLKLKTSKSLAPTTVRVSSSPVVIIEPVTAVEISANVSSSESGTENDSEAGEFARNPVSPNILAKIGQLGQGYTPGSFRKPLLSEKRKAEESPEKVDEKSLTKAEIKILRKKNKRLKKQKHKETEKNILYRNGN